MRNEGLEKLLRWLAVLLVTGGLFSWIAVAEETGHWVDVAGYNCPAGQICADWFEFGQYSAAPCCIPVESLGTSDPDACTAALPIREREREIY